MSFIAIAVDYQFFQDVLDNLAGEGILFDHVITQFHPSVSNFRFFKNRNVKAVDSSKFFKLKDLIELNKDYELPLDKNILDFLTEAERDYYISTDRYNYFPKSFRYRKLLFRESVRFWLNYLTTENINFLFASCTPHELSTYTCYHVAKYLNIPTFQLNHTIINDYIISNYDYRIGEKVPDNYLYDYSNEQIIKEIPQTLYERALSKSNVLEVSIKDNQQAMAGSVKAKQETEYSGRHNNIELANVPHLKLRDYRQKFNLLYIDRKIPKFIRRFVKRYEKKRITKLKDHYQTLAISPELNQKYIYFAMHMQPERTTTPEAGIFEDQYLTIEILSKSLPEGWKLYVKEHPAQFHTKFGTFRSIHARDKLDYSAIARLKNVVLIRGDTSSAELVKHSQIVATLLGSVGWEALLHGKPCICFGPSWYVACQSVRSISTVSEGKAAIAELQQKTKTEINTDILKYLHYMRDKLTIGNLGEVAYLDAITIPYQEHVDSVASLITNAIKNSLPTA